MARGSKKKVTISIGFDTSEAKRDLKGLDKEVERTGKKSASTGISGMALAGGALGGIAATMGTVHRAGNPAMYELASQRFEQFSRNVTGETPDQPAEMQARNVVAEQEGSRRAAGLPDRSSDQLKAAIERLTKAFTKAEEGRRAVETLPTKGEERLSGAANIAGRELRRWIRDLLP